MSDATSYPIRALLCIAVTQNFFDLPGSEIGTVWKAVGEMLKGVNTMPGLRLHVVPGEGHYSLAIRHAASILGRLTEGRQRDAERDEEDSLRHHPGEHFDSPLGNQAASPSKVSTRS